jgi:hypothetical protein
MRGSATIALMLVSVLTLLVAGGTSARADEPLAALCDLILEEERLELEEFRLELDLARSGLAAYEEVYRLIHELWENDAIERMVYLQARYDRDVARVTLERADSIIVRQVALIDYYRIACGTPGGDPDEDDRAGSLGKIGRRYRHAHCKSLEKAVEAAEIRLAFDRHLLESVHDLRDGRVATRPDVILAELAVEKEEKRLEDAKTRAEACRSEVRSE